MNPHDLSHAFFDEPGLLAVRFRGQAAGRPSKADAMASVWAMQRAPDSGGLSWSAAAPLVAVGLVAGLFLMPDCSGHRGAAVPLSAPHSTDARGESTWRPRLLSLADDLGPRRADLRPFVVRTLLDIPRELAARGDASGGWLQPGLGDGERRAQRQAARLAEELTQAGPDAAAGLAIVLDLPGPATIAAGAALATISDPVPTFESLPHPQGVVASQDTLAAAVAWAGTYRDAQTARPANAPPCFLLEGNRLAPYANQSGRFDNRSRARLPSVDAFKRLGITRLLYLRECSGDVAERDDLNELFVALAEAGITVRHAGLDRYETPALEPAQKPVATQGVGHQGVTPRWWPRPHPDDDYVAQRRPVLPALTGPLDGGQSCHDAVLSRIAAPPPERTSSLFSGGSWSRSSSSSSG